MTLKQIRTEALKLSEPSRAQLAASLLGSLGEPSEEAELDQLWAEEAARRYRDLRKNPEAGIPAEEVFRKLRSATR
jgi:putative addiction module component (TIGR02574 family)